MEQVNLKINNLNIEDIFDWQRMERLKKVFQNNLWQESHQVIMMTVMMTMMMTVMMTMMRMMILMTMTKVMVMVITYH